MEEEVGVVAKTVHAETAPPRERRQVRVCNAITELASLRFTCPVGVELVTPCEFAQASLVTTMCSARLFARGIAQMLRVRGEHMMRQSRSGPWETGFWPSG